MLRSLVALGLSFAIAPIAVSECELRSEWRGSALIHYVPKVKDCLDTPRSEIWFDGAVEARVLELINQARVRQELPPLQLRPGLLAPARIHSFDMAQEGFFDHKGPDGRKVSDRTHALDRTLIQSEIRENIAFVGGDVNYDNIAQILHDQLMGSDGHRANILAPNVTHVGIGLARKKKGAWITQVFVRQQGQFAEDVPLTLPLDPASLPEVSLREWEFAGIEFSGRSGDPLTASSPTGAFLGDAMVFVTGSKTVDEFRKSIIKLRGPLIYIDRESTASLSPQDAE